MLTTQYEGDPGGVFQRPLVKAYTVDLRRYGGVVSLGRGGKPYVAEIHLHRYASAVVGQRHPIQ